MQHRVSRRELLVGMGAMAGAGVLAACAPAAQAPQSQPAAEEQGSTQAPAAAGGEQTTVRIFDYDPTGTDLWVTADAEFTTYFAEKYPDIKVEREQAPWAGFAEKLLTSLAGGSKFDVIYGYWEWLPLFVENNAVGPLDDLIEADPEISADDFFDYAKEMVDGKTYGLAWFISSHFFWYNKTRVEAAGQPDPKELDKQGKWDYTAWYEFAKAMTGEEDGAPVFGFEMGNFGITTVYCMPAWAHGSDLWNEDFSDCLLDQPVHTDIWKYLQTFYKEGLTPMPGQTGQGEQGPGFTNGRVAGTEAGQWLGRTLVQEKTPDLFDIGMVRFPTGPAGTYAVAALNSYYFSSAPSDPTAAFTWYKERSFSEAAYKIYGPIGVGPFPSRKSIAPVAVFPFEDTEVYESIRPTMHAYRTSPKETEFSALFTAAYDEMILETRPIEQILAQLAEEAEALNQ
ncbi:MAG: ABC transporter substrate-binding protein [Anaerolineae bacterium]|jgi:ABC-type glycerol-3-phosphate transport system substrate-binding protein